MKTKTERLRERLKKKDEQIGRIMSERVDLEEQLAYALAKEAK